MYIREIMKIDPKSKKVIQLYKLFITTKVFTVLKFEAEKRTLFLHGFDGKRVHILYVQVHTYAL